MTLAAAVEFRPVKYIRDGSLRASARMVSFPRPEVPEQGRSVSRTRKHAPKAVTLTSCDEEDLVFQAWDVL